MLTDANLKPVQTWSETVRLALTPNAVIPPDAAGGFVSILIGSRDFATIFLCCLRFARPVERGGEGEVRDAVALDHCKDWIDGRRHCDNKKLPRRNASENANTGGRSIVSII
jgi:hypothetical protein